MEIEEEMYIRSGANVPPGRSRVDIDSSLMSRAC